MLNWWETPIFVEVWFFLQILDIASNEKQWISVIIIFIIIVIIIILPLLFFYYNNNNNNNNNKYCNLIFLLLSFWSLYIIIFNCIVFVQHSLSLNKYCTSDTVICPGAHTIVGVNQSVYWSSALHMALLLLDFGRGLLLVVQILEYTPECMKTSYAIAKCYKYLKFLLVVFPRCVVVSSNFLNFHLKFLIN